MISTIKSRITIKRHLNWFIKILRYLNKPIFNEYLNGTMEIDSKILELKKYKNYFFKALII